MMKVGASPCGCPSHYGMVSREAGTHFHLEEAGTHKGMPLLEDGELSTFKQLFGNCRCLPSRFYTAFVA